MGREKNGGGSCGVRLEIDASESTPGFRDMCIDIEITIDINVYAYKTVNFMCHLF